MATLFSENPENDLWRELCQFTYEANINRFFKRHDLSGNDNTINCIIGSFLQANEYYRAAKEADLQIAPLLLYYGSTNLLYGMTNLLNGEINVIKNHGMKLIVADEVPFIADTEIRFLSPKDGGVHVIARALGVDVDLTNFGDWKLREFLDSIAEIDSDYMECYSTLSSYIAMLDVFNTPDGKIEKVYCNTENRGDILEILNDVKDFSKSYLQVQSSQDHITNKEYFILRHKLNGKSISELSYSGQPYLRAAHIKNGQPVTIPTILNMYITLFALASLCRYYPERWSPFVLKDSTGERLLIEKFLFYSRRMIPNLVINRIMGESVNYVSNRYKEIDTVKHVGEHQVQEMVERKVQDHFDRQEIVFHSAK
jgi:hypothetical protein